MCVCLHHWLTPVIFCRSASVAAKAAVQSLVDEEDNIASASSEEAEKYEVNEVDDSSVWTFLII